jgi:hypothetical protein
MPVACARRRPRTAVCVLAGLLALAASPRRVAAEPAPMSGPSSGPAPTPAPSPADALALEPSAVEASRGPFGMGVLLGQPVGLSLKLYVAPDHAFQLGLGFDLVFRDAAFVTLDWVWHPVPIADTRRFELTWHIGLGGALGVWPVGHAYDCRAPDPLQPDLPPVCRTVWVQPGARAPLGFDLRFHEVPLELYVEFAPGAFFYPVLEFLGQGGFGARWHW